jgi:hypothetical protein
MTATKTRPKPPLKLQSIEREAEMCRKAFKGIVVGAIVQHCHHEQWLELLTEPAEARIAYILHDKPHNERAARLRRFRPLKPSQHRRLPANIRKAYADRQKAYADWQKAYADWQKADADWQKAYADWQKAYADRQKAYADWQKAYADWQKAYADWQKAYADWQKAYWPMLAEGVCRLAAEGGCRLAEGGCLSQGHLRLPVDKKDGHLWGLSMSVCHQGAAI